jgi:hypothetical protein
MAVQEYPGGLTGPGDESADMTRRIPLILLVLYLAAAAIDATARVGEAVRAGEKMGPAVLAVAVCGGLFWPIDLVARPLLTPG